jgi:hypothetical protein
MNRLLITMLLLALSALPVSAAQAGVMFGKGDANFGVVAGNGYAFNESYLVIGASATYYVIDGLGVGLSIENWSGSSPGMTKYSPYLQYVYYQAKVKPYVGVFYRDTEISGQPSLYSYGSRAGVYVSSGRSAHFGLGFVHESYIDCDTKVYSTCSETYPEISFIFAF